MTILEELNAVMKWLNSKDVMDKIKKAGLSAHFVIAQNSKASENGVGAMITQCYAGDFHGMVAISSAILESFYDKLNEDQKKLLTIAVFSAVTEHTDFEKGGKS